MSSPPPGPRSPYRLQRFVDAQDRGGTYVEAVGELRAGRKRSHWMWFVFPQIAGLGRSPTSRTYAISSLTEAQAYLAHPVLGPRLLECARILTELPISDPGTDRSRPSAPEIFGEIDAIKLCSSMTLFARADPANPLFGRVLKRYFGGAADAATDRLLGGTRIAVLSDVHGNLPALRAVLADLERERVDKIVVTGDVVAGPLVRQALDLLLSLPKTVRFVRGNCEREAIAVFDGEQPTDDAEGRVAAWSAQALDGPRRDAIDSWPPTLEQDGVRFCHGSPRRDDEVLTRLTPDAALAEALTGVGERLVVGGHTHQQLVRSVGDHVFANAGSVGLPYEGRRGAFWMMIEDGVPSPRETRYDLEQALAELRASGFPDLDEHLRESLLEPADPVYVAEVFERAAGRG